MDGLTDGLTDRRTDRGDYIGPLLINLGPKAQSKNIVKNLPCSATKSTCDTSFKPSHIHSPRKKFDTSGKKLL